MDVRRLDRFLQQLNSSYSSACARDAIETLLKIHRNIFFHKEDHKYRKLQLHNDTFCSKVWNVEPSRDFMLQSGWTQVDDAVHFDNDKDLLNIINVLLQYRFVAPQNSEWEPETKIENLDISKKHEENLRAKAAVERDKELAEFKKDKMFREQLAENIKRQIADDRRHNRRQFTKPVAANELRPNRSQCRQPPLTEDQLHNSGAGSSRRLGD